MERKGLLFDIEFCTGCRTCTVACKQENGYEPGMWGIKVTEHIMETTKKVQIDYAPFPTVLCTMCAKRIASGEDDVTSCVRHCPASCIEYGSLPELTPKMTNMTRPMLYLP